MTGVSRRRLLALPPLAFTVAACGLPARRPRVNVRDYGATGDGTTDDSAAIVAASAALKPGQNLYFPTGVYRFTERKPRDRAAVVISGISDVAVEFGRNAELVMDNLEGGLGTSHGILVRGPAAGITLRNVRIRWADRPAQRSFGDGIRVVGFPRENARPPAAWTGSTGPVTDVRIIDCAVRSSPQAGVIMMGVSGIKVDGLTVHDTLADGLHFNACRRGTVHNHRAFNTGDDGLALVTYYSDEFSYNTVAQTFSFPELGEWSNGEFAISNVKVVGGGANGVRLAGADGVRIRWLRVSGKRSGAGVITDSAAPGVDAGWFYVSSRAVRLNRVRIDDCEMGLQLLARPNDAADRRFTDFDVEVTNAEIRDCRNWGLRAESRTAQAATGLRVADCDVAANAIEGGNGGVGLENVGDVRLGRLKVRHADAVTVFSAIAVSELIVDDLTVTIDSDAAGDSTAAPCITFRDSDAQVDELRVSWPDAPETWQPVQIASGTGECAGPTAPQTVSVTRLSVDPSSVKDPVSRCS